MLNFIRTRIVKLLHNIIIYILTILIIHILSTYRMHLITIQPKDVAVNNDCYDAKMGVKYILIWTGAETYPTSYYLGSGCSIFKSHMCKWYNCYVTSDKTYLENYTDFDVILFNGPRLWEIAVTNYIPTIRSTHQKYVFASIESAANYPVATNIWDGFFNWTWTYRLDSDATWSYFVIRNATKHIVGPRINMNWISLSEMNSIDNETKLSLKSKTKAAAWFVSNCNTLSAREHLVVKTRMELQKYGLDIDIYGPCGANVCNKTGMDKCLEKLENTYYFYFAFENSLTEDYVTEKILYALQHNTVPVVYGGSNYSRFMPDGIYLDALKLGPKRLAREISNVMRYPESYYYNFFKWKNHYSYHYRGESPDTDEYCNFCAMLNDERLITTTIYEQFRTWWRTNLTYVDFRDYQRLYMPRLS